MLMRDLDSHIRLATGTSAPKADDPTLMRAEGLCLTLGATQLLREIDLTLTRHGITVVMGANGAGKSLLLRLLHGLIPASSGTLLWHGEPLNDQMRKRQALVLQKPVLLRRSASANIDFVLRTRGRPNPAHRDALLAYVGLQDHANRPARLLSGGEQQRLALARALACAPEVLFLDEPTANLDPASALRIEEIVRAAEAQGTKVVFVTHDVGQARRLAHDVVFLHNGRIAEHSSALRFFSDPLTQHARDYLDGRLVV